MTHTDSGMAHPAIVSQEEWLVERKRLLDHEKEQLKHYDRVNAERRRLPMVKIEKDYVFDGPTGTPSLKDLFDGRRQFIVYHFMFDPTWETYRCPGCTGWVDALGDLSLLEKRDTTLVLVSRAPLAMLEAYRRQKGWTIPWYSSSASDFNYDFHVTLDPKVAPAEYNYRNLRTPTISSMRRPMGASRTLRTHHPGGLKSQPIQRTETLVRCVVCSGSSGAALQERMANLQVVITADRQAVGALVAAACRVPPTQWALPRAVGKWSRGQVTEHVALAYDLLARLETAMRDLETGLTAASNDRRTHLDHPILGRLPLADLLRFLMIHTQHHQPQLSAATT